MRFVWGHGGEEELGDEEDWWYRMSVGRLVEVDGWRSDWWMQIGGGCSCMI